MSGITVFTTVFGNTDPLHEPVCTGSARFVCFTDQPIRSSKWEIVQMPPQAAPTRAARMMKALSHKTVDTEWSLWIDANFTLMVDPEKLLKYGEFVNFMHRDRTRISEEAREIIRLKKALPDATLRQLEAYQSDGFDTKESPQAALSCNGVILRRHTPQVVALNEMWAAEIGKHTLRDQMSLDYCAWKLGFEISRWPGLHDRNPFFRHTHYRRPVNDY